MTMNLAARLLDTALVQADLDNVRTAVRSRDRLVYRDFSESFSAHSVK